MNNQFEFRRLIRKRVQQLFVRVQSRWRAVSVTGLVFIVLHARCRHTNLRRAAPVNFFNCICECLVLPGKPFTEPNWVWGRPKNVNMKLKIQWRSSRYQMGLKFVQNWRPRDTWPSCAGLPRDAKSGERGCLFSPHPVIILSQNGVFCASGG